jgi:hypothetical protein
VILKVRQYHKSMDKLAGRKWQDVGSGNQVVSEEERGNQANLSVVLKLYADR